MSTNRSNRKTKTGTGWIGIGVVLIGLAVVGGVAVLQPAEQPRSVDSHGNAITDLRTVSVAATDTGIISTSERALRTVLLSGVVPVQPTEGTVLTDENCAPDAAGVSHCTNRIRMDDGTEITVMHPHRMADVPCLASGERIVVQAT